MRAWKFIEKNFEKWFLIISLVAMVLIIFMQVVLRWFHAATVWAEELARYIMLYQVWIGQRPTPSARMPTSVSPH